MHRNSVLKSKAVLCNGPNRYIPWLPMSKGLIAFFICVALALPGVAGQEGGTSKSVSNSKPAQKSSEAYSPGAAAKAQFMRETGYRKGRPGYVVAYRKPLVCGGADDTSNMEWLTIAEARAKDKADRKGCK
jgi:hypothetical protein